MGGSLRGISIPKTRLPSRERPSLLLDSLHRFLGKGRQNQTVVPSSTPSTCQIAGLPDSRKGAESGHEEGGGQAAPSCLPDGSTAAEPLAPREVGSQKGLSPG